jgi:hypothetical protein
MVYVVDGIVTRVRAVDPSGRWEPDERGYVEVQSARNRSPTLKSPSSYPPLVCGSGTNARTCAASSANTSRCESQMTMHRILPDRERTTPPMDPLHTLQIGTQIPDVTFALLDALASAGGDPRIGLGYGCSLCGTTPILSTHLLQPGHPGVRRGRAPVEQQPRR